MSDDAPHHPQIYLATPAQFELTAMSRLLPDMLDAAPVACVRLAMGTADEDTILRAADLLREITHTRDIPLVVDDHHRLADRLGLDGVHLTSGPRRVREVRKALGNDAIVGTFCGISRHDGMIAGEAGADYVAFGPVTASDTLGDGSYADLELFQWWSEMIEVPVVAQGGLKAEIIPILAPYADFLMISAEAWDTPDPVAALASIADAARSAAAET